jgi:methyl-accepting chemotaxis protein WspA
MLDRLNNLKLRERILLGYSIPTLFILTFSGIVYFTTSQVNTTFDQNKKQQTILLSYKEMIRHTLNMDRRIRRYLMVPDQGALNLLEQDRKAFEEIYQKSLAMSERSEDQAELKQLNSLREQLISIGFKSIEETNKNNGPLTSIQAVYIQKSLNITNSAEALAEDRVERLKAELNQGMNASQHTIALLKLTAIIGSLLSTAVALLAAYFITHSLSQRVARAVVMADKIAQGDLKHAVDDRDHRTKDEIGQLHSSFQTMLRQLNLLLGQVRQSSIQVTTSCTQLAASGRQLEGTITEQVASTNQVSTTAKQIAATSEELVSTMEEVATLSQTTALTANGQQQELQRMEGNMQQLASATDSIANKLGAISEKANNINTIVSTITKVADQTNLLSLNAAIEAEKAGEAGLGFSVVAKEIRRLADQTAIATIDIEQMIQEMQSSVSTGVMEMDKFAQEVRQGVEEVGQIAMQVGNVIAQVQELTPRFEAVNQGMEMQFQGAQQISEAMMQLSTTSSQTADSLQEITSVIEQLNNAEQNLRREVMGFKIQDATGVPA